MSVWSDWRTVDKPRSVGPRCGDATFQLGTLCQPSPCDRETCACISQIAVPGGGVMPKACLRHDDALRPSALFRAATDLNARSVLRSRR